MKTRQLDPETEKAVMSFLALISGSYDIAGAILYGSRARGTHRPDSDADVAILLNGERKSVYTVALAMSDPAFDVLMETGIDVTPLPIWFDEWEHPETHSNPALMENIRNEGIRLTIPKVPAS